LDAYRCYAPHHHEGRKVKHKQKELKAVNAIVRNPTIRFKNENISQFRNVGRRVKRARSRRKEEKSLAKQG